MELVFAPKGILQIDDARIVYRNFSGRGSQFNREGDRNFAVVIPTREMADALVNDKNEFGVAWNVKVKPPRDEDEDPFMTLSVKVKLNDRGPAIYLESGGKMLRLNEGNVNILDEIDISRVDLDIRPYDNTINGKPFRSAYLQSLKVVQNVDRFAATYGDDEQLPF